MKVIDYDIRPKKLTKGGYTLYEVVIYDERIWAHGRPMNRTKKRVWPPIKQDNGRGKVFDTAKEAMSYWLHHRGDVPILKGTFLHKRLERMNLMPAKKKPAIPARERIINEWFDGIKTDHGVKSDVVGIEVVVRLVQGDDPDRVQVSDTDVEDILEYCRQYGAAVVTKRVALL